MNIHSLIYLFDELGIKYSKETESKLKVSCAFHSPDENPSCEIDLDKLAYYCFVCGKGGNIAEYLSKKMNVSQKDVIALLKDSDDEITQFINQSKVYEWFGVLLQDAAKKLILLSRKGINTKTIENFKLGFDNDRFTIPIYDFQGNCVNVRRWSHTDQNRKYLNLEGFGGNYLYPLSSLSSDTIFITEGEFKALLLIQLGYFAITPTSGAVSWDKKWNRYFEKKKVYVVFDIDNAGRLGANRICANLYGIAKEVYNVILPLNIEKYPTGDVTDFFVKEKKTKDDFEKIVKSTKPFIPQLDVEKEDGSPATFIPLNLVTHSNNSSKVIQTKGLIPAKDIHPYIVPKKLTVLCTASYDFCAVCPVWLNRKDDEFATFEIPTLSATNLELISTKKKDLKEVLKTFIKIPKQCKQHSFSIHESRNIEEIRIIPEISTDVETTESSMTVVKGFYCGHGIETNTVYEFTGKVLPEPGTQHAALLIEKAEQTVDNISTFSLTDDVKKELKIFQPRKWDLSYVKEKLKDIYDDLSANVTKIYQRQNLHIFIDLVYHSVLHIPFNNKIIKGWIEGLLLGDTGQGKSEASSSLRRFYGLGKKIDCKTTSAAGLVGGLQTDSKRTFVSWGELVLNDRRLIILEEMKGLSKELLAILTEVRSSGIASITKIEKLSANARVRLLWISNPRSKRMLSTYNYGVEAVEELIGAAEDIRRFDMVMLVGANEVDEKWINVSKASAPKREHIYTVDLCRKLILWVWSRKYDEVIIEEDAEEELLRLSSIMGKEYASSIPIVDPSSQKLKLLRLSAAIAGRTFSSDEKGNLVIRKCHVEYIYYYLNELYSSDIFGYAQYSKQLAYGISQDSIREIEQAILSLPNSKKVATLLLNAKEFNAYTLQEWTSLDKDSVNEFISKLCQLDCAKKIRHFYYKTELFIKLLKTMLQNAETFNRKEVNFEFEVDKNEF